MLFNSYEFLVFLALTCWLYLQAPQHRRIILLTASLVFYGWWSYAYLGLFLASIIVNFALCRWIALSQAKRRGLTVAILANLSLLAVFKYTDFFITSVNPLPGLDLPLLHIALPLAISFFTFQQIAFQVDMAQGKLTPPGILDYALFVSFFPQLIAGPIVHHHEMMPQLRRRLAGKEQLINLAVGLCLFAIGLFKKTILADQFALYADGLYRGVGEGAAPGLAEAWSGALAYSLQIYFDFSGYSDMALGLARMFGVRLPLNFFSPYKARSAIDFWRRWHVTLSRFLRDYVYIPLGGSRHGPARRYANLLITMLLGGLWHGAGWTFVAWGGLHGVFLAINHAWRGASAPGRPLAAWSSVGRTLGPALTFLGVVVAWVFFRAESFGAAWQVLTGMVGLHGLGAAQPYLFDFNGDEQLIWLAIGLAIVWFMPNSLEIMRRYRPAIDPTGIGAGFTAAGAITALHRATTWRPTPLWALCSGAVAAAAMLGISDVSPFLYFQF